MIIMVAIKIPALMVEAEEATGTTEGKMAIKVAGGRTTGAIIVITTRSPGGEDTTGEEEDRTMIQIQ